MSTDDLVEERLRRSLHEHETDLLPTPDLAEVTRALGRMAVRRRRRAALVGVVSASVAVAIGLAVVLAPTGDDRSGPPPATHTTAPVAIVPGPWVTSLPVGDPPTVSYVGGTTVYLPDREVELDGYDDASMIGNTVAGTIVFGEQNRNGTLFSTEYLLITPDGVVSHLADGAFHGAREGVVSPDGRYFAHDETVMDLSDMSVVAQIPAGARILLAWTADGVAYDGAGGRVYVWQPGHEPRRLQAGSSIGPRGFTVSPDGRWRVTQQLELIDTETKASTWLAGAPLTGSAPSRSGTYWEDDDHVLMSVNQDGLQAGEYGVVNGAEVAFLARCDVVAGTCERVSGAVPVTRRLTIELSPYL